MCKSRLRPYDFRPSKQNKLYSVPAISAAISDVPTSINPPWGARITARESGRSSCVTRKSLPGVSCCASSANDAYVLTPRLDSDRIQRAVREHRGRQEPRGTEIIGPRRKWQTIESGAALLETNHLLSDPPPEVGRERHALTAISHAVVNPLVLPQMRQRIEGVCDPPHPRVSDSHPLQLRENLAQHALQPRYAGERIFLRQCRPTAEDDALAIGRGPVVNHHSSRIDDIAAVRDERANPLDSQCLRGNLIAADRNHAPAMPWRHGSRVAVRGDQDLACLEFSLRCFDLEPTPVRLNGFDRAMIQHGDAALLCTPQ